ncbi:uncharacterized protein BROUX77_003314 [Berkeleyomyces rouxiae]|uniref:uncharacterized protein n=1 Tax=Berkeleyomyces rouxiae TaxID=2035830 RepID=UPI003B7BDC45
MNLLTQVKNSEDLDNMSPVPVYMYGMLTSAPASYVFRDYVKTRHFEDDATSVVAPGANPTEDRYTSHFIPTLDEEGELSMILYNIELLKDGKTREDFEKLPSVTFLVGSQTTIVPVSMHFYKIYMALTSVYSHPPATEVDPKAISISATFDTIVRATDEPREKEE